jgi:hypothetical protein
VPNDDYIMSVGLQTTNRKIGKIVSLYRREMFKKIPRLGTFCTVSKRWVKNVEVGSNIRESNDTGFTDHAKKNHISVGGKAL